MKSFFEHTLKRDLPGAIVGDPVLEVTDGYMIIYGYGDFRIPPDVAREMISFHELAKQRIFKDLPPNVSPSNLV